MQSFNYEPHPVSLLGDKTNWTRDEAVHDCVRGVFLAYAGAPVEQVLGMLQGRWSAATGETLFDDHRLHDYARAIAEGVSPFVMKGSEGAMLGQNFVDGETFPVTVRHEWIDETHVQEQVRVLSISSVPQPPERNGFVAGRLILDLEPGRERDYEIRFFTVLARIHMRRPNGGPLRRNTPMLGSIPINDFPRRLELDSGSEAFAGIINIELRLSYSR